MTDSFSIITADFGLMLGVSVFTVLFLFTIFAILEN
jgi:hypothetical protein